MRLLLLSFLLLGGAARAEVPVSADARGTFAGSWRVAAGESARLPGDAADAVPDSTVLGSRIAFLPDRVDAVHPLGCGNASYETVVSPAAGLFQGVYGDGDEAVRRAEALALSATATPTLRVICDTGSFDYHHAPAGAQPERLVIMLDRVIYTLRRD